MSSSGHFNETQARGKNTAYEAKETVKAAFNETAEATEDAAEEAQIKAHQAKEQTKEAAEEAKQKSKRAAEEAKQKGKEVAEETKEKAIEAKDTFIQKLREDGVVNPEGLTMAGAGAIFLAAIPVTTAIATQIPWLEKAVNGVAHSVVWLGSAGNQSTVAQTGKIAALSTLYVAVTYAFSGAGSAAGVAAGNEKGRDNLEPRKQVANLQGLPLRLHSAHYNLMEMFPGFALTAALTQAIAPADQSLINLLGLHVLAKVFVHYPAYLFNFGTTRTVAHVLATASVINVGLRLAKKSIL